MLVKLRMSVEETIEEFDKICEEVHMKTDYTPAERTSRLRKCIEDLLSRKKVPIDTKMYDESDENSCQRCDWCLWFLIKTHKVTVLSSLDHELALLGLPSFVATLSGMKLHWI